MTPTFLQSGDALMRFGAFAGVFLVMALLELLLPRRRLNHAKARRWFTNIAIGGIDSLLLRLMAMLSVPLAAAAAALTAAQKDWGLLNLVALPGWLEMMLALLVLDLAIYAQHVASHHVPVLWRLHKMHHADVDFDVTTAIRFHPVEIALSMLWKIVVVFALGPSALAVVLFEVLLNACAMFNHANVALPKPLDAALRVLLVTPDMHRVHHSIEREEHDRNFGFNLSVWDRLFGTYTAQPAKGHEGMTIGLKPYQGEEPTGLAWSLLLPLRRPRGASKDRRAP
ncbi:MAG: sterol desaturase family protein [Pseudomonadota bacterium]|nr:sterol desaturase family protein [Pseudomonadota bacterium]